MRTLLSVVAVAIACAWMALAATAAGAKTVVQVTPASGPPGSVVQIEGFGFSESEVRIAVGPKGAAEYGFVDVLPEADLMTLEVVPVVNGAVEAMTVTLPGAYDYAWQDQVDILAIAEDPPTADTKYFVAGATFDVTPAALADAGTGPYDSNDSAVWLVVSLAAFGVVVMLGGLRLRATTAR